MKLFSKRQEQSISLVLDIGSASVGAALVLYEDGEQPRILYTKRILVSFAKKTSSKQLVSAMAESLGRLMDFVQKEGLKHLTFTKVGHKQIDDVHVVLASPWYLCQTHVLRETKEKGFVITTEKIQYMLDEHSEKVRSTLKSQKSMFSEDVEELETRAMSVSLNGYYTDKPHGKYARSLEISVFTSVYPKAVRTTIERAVNTAVHIDDIYFHSFSLASFAVLRGLFVTFPRYLLVDVTGEVTDVGVIEEGVLTDSASFPVGKHNVLRILEDKLGLSGAEARSLLHRYRVGDVSEALKEKIEAAVNNLKEDWSEGFDEVFKNYGGGMPHKVFFLADEDCRACVKEWMLNYLGAKEKERQIVAVTEKTLEPFIGHSGSISRDMYLSIDALYMDILSERQ